MSANKVKVFMNETELVNTISVLIGGYDHSIEIVEDIIVFSKKLEELLQTGVESIEV